MKNNQRPLKKFKMLFKFQPRSNMNLKKFKKRKKRTMEAKQVLEE